MYRQMYLKDVEIAKKVHILAPTDKILNRLYIRSTIYMKYQNRQLFHKLYFILRDQIVSNRTLWNLSLELVYTDICNDILTNSTDNFILSARVRRALRPSHTGP